MDHDVSVCAASTPTKALTQLMAKIGVFHALSPKHPQTVFDFVGSFARYASDHEFFYVNTTDFTKVPLLPSELDVSILTYDLLAWRRGVPALLMRFRKSLRRSGKIVMFSQDDYTESQVLDRLVIDLNVSHVFSPLAYAADVLYPESVLRAVPFSSVYTGYLEESHLSKYVSMCIPFGQRSVDVGQRVRLLSRIEHGDFAARKGEVTLAFADAAQGRGFFCDVSTDENDRLAGDAWLRFLGDTRFVVGGESGASRIDANGSIARRARFLRKMMPGLTEMHLLNALKLAEKPQTTLKALSGRFFEAAAMGCCQVLLPGDYPSGLEAGSHYLALNEDLSNSTEVLDKMRDRDLCEWIAGNCLDAVQSNASNTYRGFVEGIFGTLGINMRQNQAGAETP